MRTLADAGGGVGGPAVRVGGNSADEAVWQPSGALPPNVTYRVTAADFAAYAAAIPQWNGSVIVDVTLRDASGGAAAAHAAAAAAALPPALLESFEVGNEPDLFFENGIRAPGYGYADYRRDFAAAAVCDWQSTTWQDYAAVRVANASFVTVAGVEVAGVGGAAVWLDEGTRDSAVVPARAAPSTYSTCVARR
jgi:hypothetical protein